MSHFSDPTANAAVGNINREFSRLEKKAKHLCRLFLEGKLSSQDLQKAGEQFTGIYRHVLTNALIEAEKESNAEDEAS